MNFDPHQLLIAAETAILGRSETTANSTDVARKPTSWWNAIIITIVVIGAMLVHAWVSWRRGKELAKLRHERNVARIEAENQLAKEKVAESQDIADHFRKQRERLQDEFRLLDAEVRAEVKRYEADIRAIDRISDWSQLDGGQL